MFSILNSQQSNTQRPPPRTNTTHPTSPRIKLQTHSRKSQRFALESAFLMMSQLIIPRSRGFLKNRIVFSLCSLQFSLPTKCVLLVLDSVPCRPQLFVLVPPHHLILVLFPYVCFRFDLPPSPSAFGRHLRRRRFGRRLRRRRLGRRLRCRMFG